VDVGDNGSEGACAALIFGERGCTRNHLPASGRAEPPSGIGVWDGLRAISPNIAKALKRDGAGEIFGRVGDTGVVSLCGGGGDGDDRDDAADQQDGGDEEDEQPVSVVEELAFDREAKMLRVVNTS
jgi:hypothetical protein